MPTNRELYQCAKLLIDQHGDDGAIDHCDRRIMHHVGERDTDGADVWKGIRVAVRHLIDGVPGPVTGLRGDCGKNGENVFFGRSW